MGPQSHGELFSSLGPSPSDNSPTGSGSHPDEKAVRSFSAFVVRLICPLHPLSPQSSLELLDKHRIEDKVKNGKGEKQIVGNGKGAMAALWGGNTHPGTAVHCGLEKARNRSIGHGRQAGVGAYLPNLSLHNKAVHTNNNRGMGSVQYNTIPQLQTSKHQGFPSKIAFTV